MRSDKLWQSQGLRVPVGTKVALFTLQSICRIMRRPLNRETMVREGTKHAEAVWIVQRYALANKTRHMSEVIIKPAVPIGFRS